LLRRSYDPLPSLIGVATLGSTSLVIQHAFEARFYGPWFLLTVLYVTALTRVVDSNGALRPQILAGCSAALLCLIHYFGIITLTLATAGAGIALLLREQRLRLLWPPFLSGMAALALTVPLLLGQKAALSGPVWITPACCASEFLVYLESFLALPQVALVLIIAALGVIVPQLRRSATSARAPNLPDPAVTALLAIGLLPVVLVMLELAGQPVLIPRYALPALVALAPLTAAASAPLRGIARAACLLVIAVHGVFGARAAQLNARTTTTRHEREREAGQAAIRQAREMQSVVIVPRRHQLYPLLEELPAEAAPLFALPMLPADVVRRRFPVDTDSAAAGSLILMEQDVARVHERIFGRPTLVSIDAAVDSTCWLLLDTNDSPAFATRWLPRHRARRVRPLLFVLEPIETSGRSRECGPVRAGSTRVTFAPVLPAMHPFPAPTSPPTSTR
jgi:hypothetical protein